LSSPEQKTATPCAPSRSKSVSNQRRIRSTSPRSASRWSWLTLVGSLWLVRSPSSSEFTRVEVSRAFGVSLGSRSTYTLIAQPCAARNSAS
jgi:hypothetical protein